MILSLRDQVTVIVSLVGFFWRCRRFNGDPWNRYCHHRGTGDILRAVVLARTMTVEGRTRHVDSVRPTASELVMSVMPGWFSRLFTTRIVNPHRLWTSPDETSSPSTTRYIIGAAWPGRGVLAGRGWEILQVMD